MLGGRGCLAALNFLYYARAAKNMAGVSRLVFHASIVFQRSEDRFGVAKSNTNRRAYFIRLLAFEGQHIRQKGFNTIIHRFCPDVVPELSGDLTVGRATADYPAMGFNKRKMGDRRRQAAEKELLHARATEKQILEDADHLITVWNERQAKRMPMLFSQTIGAAITAGYWFLRARCPACRTTGDVDLRTLDWAPRRCRDGPYARVVVPILPSECALRGIGVPIEVERCRGILRGAHGIRWVSE
jgi:hypothetical protein